MAVKLNANLKNYIINQEIITQIAGTSGTAGTASLLIYTGSQPANADAVATGTLLCTIGSIGWNLATAGTAALCGTYSGTAATTGTAGWARMSTVNSNGTFCIDGDVSISSTSVFQINGAALNTEDVVQLQSANILIS